MVAGFYVFITGVGQVRKYGIAICFQQILKIGKSLSSILTDTEPFEKCKFQHVSVAA